MLVDGADYVIRVTSLPCKVNGFVTYDEDARANIYINDRITIERQKQTVLHELWHVWRGDVFGIDDIRTVEGDA